MEQIGKLVFATVFLSIFSYLLFFSSMGQAGNGGEYWGFSGYTEPRQAAAVSFDEGDYRFLEVTLIDEYGNLYQDAPAYQRCDNHPLGADNALHASATEPIHGLDSTRLAAAFARGYNQEMTWLLRDKMNQRCEIVVD